MLLDVSLQFTFSLCQLRENREAWGLGQLQVNSSYVLWLYFLFLEHGFNRVYCSCYVFLVFFFAELSKSSNLENDFGAVAYVTVRDFILQRIYQLLNSLPIHCFKLA